MFQLSSRWGKMEHTLEKFATWLARDFIAAKFVILIYWGRIEAQDFISSFIKHFVFEWKF